MPKSHCELTVNQMNGRQRLCILKWRKEQKKQEKIDWIAENKKTEKPKIGKLQSKIDKFILSAKQLRLF